MKNWVNVLYSILGLYRDNGKENGNYCSILGLYWDNGKENGNYYSTLVGPSWQILNSPCACLKP